MCERAVHLKPDTYSARRAVPPLRSWVALRCFGNRCAARSSRCSPKRRDFRQTMNSIFASSMKSIGPMPTTRCPLKATQSRQPWLRECGRGAGTPSMTLVIAEIATPSRRGVIGRIQEHTRVSARVALYSAEVGGGARRHASALRPSGKRTRAFGARGVGTLAFRLHPPVPGWERPHGALSDEYHAGFGGLSLDGDSHQGSQVLSERPGPRQHRDGHPSVHNLYCPPGAMAP